jgi:FkbM family methyltransferase
LTVRVFAAIRTTRHFSTAEPRREHLMPNEMIDTAVQRAFRLLGLRVGRLSSSFEASVLAGLARNRIDTIVDVGSNSGQFAQEMRALGFGGTIHSFEPLPDVASVLRSRAAADGRWHVHECALGDADGTVEFHVTRNRVSSSLLRPRDFQLHSEVGAVEAERISVSVRRLDNLANSDLGSIDWERTYLKLDVQGAEAMVLRGCGALLRQVPLLLTEVSFQSLYDGSSSWTSVVEMCAESGLVTIDFQRAFRDPLMKRVMQADLLLERIDKLGCVSQ